MNKVLGVQITPKNIFWALLTGTITSPSLVVLDIENPLKTPTSSRDEDSLTKLKDKIDTLLESAEPSIIVLRKYTTMTTNFNDVLNMGKRDALLKISAMQHSLLVEEKTMAAINKSIRPGTSYTKTGQKQLFKNFILTSFPGRTEQQINCISSAWSELT